ncbi:hypothetical protein INT45_013470 [Circinella minor]|uniref:Uncharacterized protein n=1 Tax=Circinella minor TaxID=1195481 RepID=A0A8H7RSF1_9FUNG|nr:hypothetical protein INT45_013470 [Circinella minor]
MCLRCAYVPGVYGTTWLTATLRCILDAWFIGLGITMDPSLAQQARSASLYFIVAHSAYIAQLHPDHHPPVNARSMCALRICARGLRIGNYYGSKFGPTGKVCLVVFIVGHSARFARLDPDHPPVNARSMCLRCAYVPGVYGTTWFTATLRCILDAWFIGLGITMDPSLAQQASEAFPSFAADHVELDDNGSASLQFIVAHSAYIAQLHPDHHPPVNARSMCLRCAYVPGVYGTTWFTATLRCILDAWFIGLGITMDPSLAQQASEAFPSFTADVMYGCDIV